MRWLSATKTLIVLTSARRGGKAFATTNINMEDKIPTKYESGSNSVAFVTTPTKDSARKLARGIIEQKLAACVNIIPQIESIYVWEGKVNEDNEYLMMIKTRTERIDELTKYVSENHPYSVAEVISLPIENGNLPYLNWIRETVREKPESE
ncbi:divalent-cation tolerance protein CutA [Drosophila tropicalis]|uniref:divalent-cation tolerance protein CutA n=1 Tax=Drosophila tropicalis TaxID=46794 RepID=UPI0035AB7FAD